MIDVFRRHYRKVKLLFGLTDILFITIAFGAAYETRLRLQVEHNFYLSQLTIALLLGVSALSWITVARWFEIYDRVETADARTIVRDAFQQCAIATVAVVLLEYLLRFDLSRLFLAFFALYSWFLLSLFRLNARRLLGIARHEFGRLHFVMIVGTGDGARNVGLKLEESAPHGMRLLGFFAPEGERVEPVTLSRAYETHPLSSLNSLLRRDVVDEIIFALDSRRLAEMEEIFLLCDEEGVRTRVMVDFFPHVHSQMYLDRLGATPMLTFTAAPDDEIRLLLKRATDVVLAMAALAVLLPIMAFVAALIRVTSRGPVIFRQVRCGLNGRRFVFYKFRSMCENAEEMRAALEHLNRKSTAFKIPNDPRLTALGRWLRKFSIDEWPQLWNVLKGDMSLVGPRPAVPQEVDNYERWQRRRLRMRPGLTCLWAIAGRDTLDFDTWMKMDMQYIDNWSLALDWKIILRTIPRVVTGRGAH